VKTTPSNPLSWLTRLRARLHKRRVRKVKDRLLYWAVIAEAYQVLYSAIGIDHDRERMVEARAKRDLYHARLVHLMENNRENHSL